MTPVNVTLPARDYDAVVKVAASRRVSVQDVIRRSIKHEIARTAPR